MKIELIISIVCALVAAFKWVYEYTEKLKWDKNKFLVEQIEKFQSLESTKAMETLLDWNGSNVTINGEKLFVNDETLIGAFQTHDVKHKFNSIEFKLRNVFDDYFDNFTKLVFMSKVGLVEKESLVIFSEYWINILSGESKNKPRELVESIQYYLEYYEYYDLLNFIISK
jgi:hypothetical protein